MVGWLYISVVCVLIHPAYNLVVQYMNFGFACVGCTNVIFEGQFSSTFGGRDIFHGDEVVKRG